jgi:hypothetical protein
MPHRNLIKRNANSTCQGTAKQPQLATLSPTELFIGEHSFSIMTPSGEDVTNFLAFAPEAGEGKAFLFLEVSHPDS